MSVANVDLDEIEKFSRLGDSWWDPQGPCAPLHHFNPCRLSFIQAHTELSQQKLIDIGCGGGLLSEALARTGAQVTGIDLSETALNCAQQHATQSGLTIDYQLSSAEQYAQQHAQSFDIVTCMELLEHVPDAASLVAACARLCKPGGWVFFSTINRTAKAYTLAVLGAEYILRLLPRGTHDYQKFIRPTELIQWSRDNQLQIQQLQGVRYHPFAKQCQTSSSLAINYQCAFQLAQ